MARAIERSMQRVLITGASSGLGRGLALEYAREGATVGLVARRSELLAEVAADVSAAGGRALVFEADVTDTALMSTVVAQFAEQAGGLDVVIANAGIGEGRREDAFDPEKAARVFHVNVIGLCNTLLPAANLMRKSGHGSLVGMASVAGYRALPGSLSYSASKGAVMTFMEGLGLELSGTEIHTMSLCPGFIRTPLTDKNHFKMPFLMETPEACQRMKRAIDKKKRRYTFPLPFFLAAQILRVAPGFLLRSAVARLKNGPR